MMDTKTYEYMKNRVEAYQEAEKSIEGLKKAKSVMIEKASNNYDFGFTYGNGSSSVFVPKKYKDEFIKFLSSFVDECVSKEVKAIEEI